MNKNQSPDTREALQRWQFETHSPAYLRRSAQRNAAFLLPLLRPGMRLLDVGCGPGSITVGLAEAVGADGEAVGVDLSAAMIDAARALAAERGVTNVGYDIADACALPFEDMTFDAAFSHALLQHLPDPLMAVREMHRVLKPGGVIGIADADLSGSLIHPSTPSLQQSLELMIALRRHDGGTPDAGRRLRELLHDAGFPNTAASVIADADGAKETAARAGEWQARYFEAPPLVAHVVAAGLASQAELLAMSAAWRAWGSEPGAFWARFWCQSVGWK